MQNPTLKKSNLKPPRYWEYVLAFFFIIIPSACIDKREILKEGSRVTIPCDDISIDGILYTPGDPGENDPAVIVLHGWLEPGENGADMVSIVAWHLAREGYVSLALSMRGWPDTGGNDDCGGRQPFDVVQAAQWLSRHGAHRPSRILTRGACGTSDGRSHAKSQSRRGFFPRHRP